MVAAYCFNFFFLVRDKYIFMSIVYLLILVFANCLFILFLNVYIILMYLLLITIIYKIFCICQTYLLQIYFIIAFKILRTFKKLYLYSVRHIHLFFCGFLL